MRSTPEQLFRKLYSRRMQFSRTALLSEATDVRWVTLNCQTRAKAHIQGERPCYVNLLLHLLPQLPSARWRWLPPQLPLAGWRGRRLGWWVSSSPLGSWLRHRLHRWRLWRRWVLCDAARAHPVRLSPAHRQHLRILIEPYVLSIQKAPVAR